MLPSHLPDRETHPIPKSKALRCALAPSHTHILESFLRHTLCTSQHLPHSSVLKHTDTTTAHLLCREYTHT